MNTEVSLLKRDEKGRLVKGTPPGPGRPKGSVSIKDKVRQYLENNPEAVEEIVQHFVKNNRELMWQMLEGKPSQDITSKGEKLPTPIYVPGDESTQENIETDKKG